MFTTLRQKGFTLVELVVVMAVIAVLAALALFAINAARIQQRNTQRRSHMSSFKVGLEAAYANSGTNKTYAQCAAVSVYTQVAAATGCMVAVGGQSGNNMSSYLSGFPVNDPSGSGHNNRLCYASSAATSYVAYVVLEPPSGTPPTCNVAGPGAGWNAEYFSQT